ncbi:glucose/arabinose dehydrogenase [Caulobacter ginsengisoli]|uniref:Glucose/arabinose dehydrogenase n=1 Tax=Caulobacter ginsengisoli TaxID=400775 RepID=A0ABU0J0G8_9CAUL|nr:sorbosone dehydrogenase family protein [Caulobacter ginsengisoli]MDQ0466784.1 glucose/arabinose dehydrogenase [Caulobacter ginsengisoli]
MRRSPTLALLLTGAALLALSACGKASNTPASAGYGPNPNLPAPQTSALPTVKTAKAIGWPAGATPTPAPGLAVARFAEGLNHPRWLYRLPNGDVLVAETNGPANKPKGFKGWAAKIIMGGAGAGQASPDRIVLLRDADGDGVAETRHAFLTGLHSPFGMALIGSDLYVANTDAVLKFHYIDNETEITTKGVKILDLPAGPINMHWARNLLAAPDGSKLYVSVGSNSNIGENGLDTEIRRASILQMNPDGTDPKVFASGLRNPNGMAWNPANGELWTAVNERDELGNDLVPDYMTSVKPGGFYGWPYSYYGQHIDARVKTQRPDLVAKAIVPDYALGPHTASLGLLFYTGVLLPEQYRGGVFVGQHGSWNRNPPSGYKVVFIPFVAGKPSGPARDILTGFLDKDGKARGRPVGVIEDQRGAVLVADDVGGVIWRVTPVKSVGGE